MSFTKGLLGETESVIIISVSLRGFSRLIYNSLWGTLARLLLRSLQFILEGERCPRPVRFIKELKGLAKLGNIVAETMFLVMFPGMAKLANICFRRKICQTTSKHCPKKRAARAARLFFFIQPIKSLTCGVVVDVAVVRS